MSTKTTMVLAETESPKEFLRTKGATQFVGMGKSCFWGKIKKDPKAPKPFKLGGVLLWKIEDLREWVEGKRV